MCHQWLHRKRMKIQLSTEEEEEEEEEGSIKPNL